MSRKTRQALALCGAMAVCLACAPVMAAGQEAADTPADAAKQVVVLQVYKKWIGAAGDEADVEIDLFCPQPEAFEPRLINRDKPGGWEIVDVPPDGVFCSVHEVERDSFVADGADCLNLLVIPGQEIECTIVNTKVVKRIDMLNRYGMVMMIAVMLGAGLAAVRRFSSL